MTPAVIDIEKVHNKGITFYLSVVAIFFIGIAYQNRPGPLLLTIFQPVTLPRKQQ